MLRKYMVDYYAKYMISSSFVRSPKIFCKEFLPDCAIYCMTDLEKKRKNGIVVSDYFVPT